MDGGLAGHLAPGGPRGHRYPVRPELPLDREDVVTTMEALLDI